MSNKVFILSLHRSMTRSTDKLLRKMGLTTIHWIDKKLEIDYTNHETDLDYVFKQLEQLEHDYDAFSDVPIPVLYHQAYTKHPDAKFILVYRNPFDWVRSVRKHINTRMFDPAEKVQYWHYLKDCPIDLTETTDYELFSIYTRHYSDIISYFKNNNILNQLCLVDINDPECGRRICAFLDSSQNFHMPHIASYPSV